MSQVLRIKNSHQYQFGEEPFSVLANNEADGKIFLINQTDNEYDKYLLRTSRRRRRLAFHLRAAEGSEKSTGRLKSSRDAIVTANHSI